MTHRFTWTLKTLLITGIIVLANYPIAFAICHDITPHYTTLITTLLVISLLYGFSVLCGPHHFHALLIGLLAGNLIALLTWIMSFREILFHLIDANKLSVFYSLGVFFPVSAHLFLSMKRDSTDHAASHVMLTTAIMSGLFIFLLVRMFTHFYYKSVYFSFFHFSLGFLAGLITVIIIHFILSRNILVFQKLSFYIQVMLKPIVAFFLGYLLIMFTFSGLYTLIYFSDPGVFTHLNNDTFGELMFYSFSTITGMSFSVVEPEKPIAFFLTTAEHFLGLVWMSVVFAAALAHLQLPFSRISEQLDKLVDGEIKKNK